MPDRFEREIDEILRKIDDFPQGAARRRRSGNSLGHKIGGLQRSLAVRLSHISVAQVMLTSLGLMLISYLLKALWGELWVYGLTLGLILFFTAFALSFRNSSGGRSSQPYYRGRPRSYYESNGPTLPERLREWWRQRKYRR
ncbi:MAG TPA: hypothetical protein VFA70_01860 [Dehalococcoidia bacterium]|jgi:hypothetical protein|nr:hypothetical protein [Dehalococcoidia bacterium]